MFVYLLANSPLSSLCPSSSSPLPLSTSFLQPSHPPSLSRPHTKSENEELRVERIHLESEREEVAKNKSTVLMEREEVEKVKVVTEEVASRQKIEDEAAKQALAMSRERLEMKKTKLKEEEESVTRKLLCVSFSFSFFFFLFPFLFFFSPSIPLYNRVAFLFSPSFSLSPSFTP